MKVQIYFELILILTTMFLNFYIRWSMNYLELYIDEIFAKISDYSIMVRKIPPSATKQDIQDMIEVQKNKLQYQQLQETNNLKIVDILMVQDLSEYLKVQEQNMKKIKKQIKLKQKNPNLQVKYYQNPIVPHRFAQTAIIIFSNSTSKSYFLDSSFSWVERVIRTFWGSYYPRSNVHQIKGEYVSIYKAPQPDDLIWENCGKKSTQLFFRRVGLYFLSFLVLCLGGLALYGIESIRNNHVKPENTVQQFLFSLFAALIINIFNFLIEQILQFMAQHEGHDTKTQLKVAVTFRIVFFQFFNSGVFLLLSNIFVKIMENDKHTYDFKKSILSYNIVQFIVLNAVIANFNNYIMNKYQIVNLFPRRQILKKKKLYPQLEANQIFEPPSIFMHAKYSYLFKTFWITVFFLPTMPSVALISTCGLLVNYWVQKYLFSGIYKAPESISSYLSNHVLNLLDYTPLWLTLGSIFVYTIKSEFNFTQIPKQTKTFHIAFLILSLTNILLPSHTILKRLKLVREAKPNQTTYQQSLVTFQLTYEDTNPFYSRNHKKRIREQEIFRQQITKEAEFQQMRMRISQSQMLNSYKQSLLFRSSVASDSGFANNRKHVSSIAV